MGGRFGRCLVRLRNGFGNAFDFDRLVIACVVDEGHLAWFCRSYVLIALGQRCNTSGHQDRGTKYSCSVFHDVVGTA